MRDIETIGAELRGAWLATFEPLPAEHRGLLGQLKSALADE